MNIEGYSTLQIAITKKNFEIVNTLLMSTSIDINLVTSKGTALHIACNS